MEWREEGIVLATRRHGETSVILDLFTRDHGRHLGLVRGGRSSRMRSALQPGNSVLATWRARLDEHLGSYTVEPSVQRVAAIIDHGVKLSGLATLTALAQLVPEREAHARLHGAFTIVLDALGDDDVWPALLVRWELGLLDELGFGLDLGSCAATGTTEDLAYVSPRSGRAVSRQAGAAYEPKLLRLPGFLTGGGVREAGLEDVLAGFSLTGHFLDRHVFAARGIRAPEARERLVSTLRRKLDETSP